ncbi:ABC-type cobalt transport system, permease component CbiQ [Corynebacterium kutscheri]|uniref:ABC-type cobalt transport system, permease component CbiQ n=1 Tax=Corynebacterium kutscheri TaxID=35755 RepID=A0A0F6TCY2_9CORY|nr:CbiQ family ECF transporter T component [Corynebacterium kutscheri]AKE41144.1 ABC-type cobalt transport system, permease component CbiQ [Corynebacterium kutscheri]VEH09464.1 Energy-coupling factor transporter transmembrane protein CbiQ [Corynebacterium kutscheri]
MNPLEQAASKSPWAQVHILEKTVLFFGLTILSIIMHSWQGFSLLACILIALILISRVPLRVYLSLVLAPATFIALGLGPLIFALTPSGFVLIDGGISNAIIVLCRSTLAMSSTMLFALTTPFPQVLSGLHKLHLPETLVQVIAQTYRMSTMLVTTSQVMWQASAQRLGQRTFLIWIHSVAHQAASLFVISFTRARRMQDGIQLRGDLNYALTYGTHFHSQPPRLCLVLFYLLGFIVLGILCRLFL